MRFQGTEPWPEGAGPRPDSMSRSSAALTDFISSGRLRNQGQKIAHQTTPKPATATSADCQEPNQPNKLPTSNGAAAPPDPARHPEQALGPSSLGGGHPVCQHSRDRREGSRLESAEKQGAGRSRNPSCQARTFGNQTTAASAAVASEPPRMITASGLRTPRRSPISPQGTSASPYATMKAAIK